MDLFMSEAARLKQLKSIETKMKICDYTAALVACSGILIMAPESSLYYDYLSEELQATYDCLIATKNNFKLCKLTPKSPPEETYASFLRALVSLGTIIVEMFLVLRYLMLVKYAKARKEVRSQTTLCNSRLKWLLIIEMLYILLHLPPHVNYTWIGVQQGNQLTYTLDTLFTIVLIGRVYLIFRVVSVYSVWNSDKAIEVCNENLCEGGPGFALKAEVKTRPYIITGSGMVIFIFALGFAMKILEQPYEYVSGLNWDYVWNGLWCVIAAMTTVGYGDFYPRTHLGRLVCIVGAVIGAFLVSLMVVAMSESSTFDHAEQRAFDKYKKIEEVKDLRKQSVRTIAAAYRLHRMIGVEPSRYQLNKKTELLKHHLLLFRKLRKAFVTGELATPLSYLIDQFQVKLNARLDKMYYFGVVIKRLEKRTKNIASCQQAIGDLADKVYSQSMILNAEINGNPNAKIKIRQTINNKETSKLLSDEQIDVEAMLEETKNLIAAQKSEAQSPRKKTLILDGRISPPRGRTLVKLNDELEQPLNSTQPPNNQNTMSPVRQRTLGPANFTEAQARVGGLQTGEGGGSLTKLRMAKLVSEIAERPEYSNSPAKQNQIPQQQLPEEGLEYIESALRLNPQSVNNPNQWEEQRKPDTRGAKKNDIHPDSSPFLPDTVLNRFKPILANTLKNVETAAPTKTDLPAENPQDSPGRRNRSPIPTIQLLNSTKPRSDKSPMERFLEDRIKALDSFPNTLNQLPTQNLETAKNTTIGPINPVNQIPTTWIGNLGHTSPIPQQPVAQNANTQPLTRPKENTPVAPTNDHLDRQKKNVSQNNLPQTLQTVAKEGLLANGNSQNAIPADLRDKMAQVPFWAKNLQAKVQAPIDQNPTDNPQYAIPSDTKEAMNQAPFWIKSNPPTQPTTQKQIREDIQSPIRTLLDATINGVNPEKLPFVIKTKDTNPLANQQNLIKYDRSRKDPVAKNHVVTNTAVKANLIMGNNNVSPNMKEPPTGKRHDLTPLMEAMLKSQRNAANPNPSTKVIPVKRLSKLQHELSNVLSQGVPMKIDNKNADVYKPDAQAGGVNKGKLLGIKNP